MFATRQLFITSSSILASRLSSFSASSSCTFTPTLKNQLRTLSYTTTHHNFTKPPSPSSSPYFSPSSSFNMDPFQLLISDHRTVDGLFEKLLRDNAYTEEKHRVLNSLIKELSIHSVIEELYLYPTIRRVYPDGINTVEKAIGDHQRVKEMVDRLDKYSSRAASDPSIPYPYTELKTLQREVATHVADEESRLFPNLRNLLTAQELLELHARLLSGKKSAPTHPHPLAPNRPPFNKIAGMGAAMVDKIRDTGREFAEKK